jgi:hypothetical protein
MTNEEIIYPIGRFQKPEKFSLNTIKDCIEELAVLPRILDHCIENLDNVHLLSSYREGGWNINQIVHHIADSHMNAFIRCKLALTEEHPTIKPYNQDFWATTADVTDVPVNYSITLVHALHHRWVKLLSQLSLNDLERTYYHPEYKSSVPIWEVIQLYAWHGQHHAAQIRALRLRMGW